MAHNGDSGAKPHCYGAIVTTEKNMYVPRYMHVCCIVLIGCCYHMSEDMSYPGSGKQRGPTNQVPLLQPAAPQSILKSVTIPKEGGHVRSLNRESACPWNSETLEVDRMGFVLWTPIPLRPCKPRKSRRRWYQSPSTIVFDHVSQGRADADGINHHQQSSSTM